MELQSSQTNHLDRSAGAVLSNGVFLVQPDLVRPDFGQTNLITQTEVGGPGGDKRYDQPLGEGVRLRRMFVEYGAYIDSITMEVQVADSQYRLQRFGGGGGSHEYTLDLREGEYIARIIVSFAQYIDSMQIFTNQGQYSGILGGSGGILSATLGNFDPSRPNGTYQILGFHGWYHDYIDRLGVYYQQVLP